MMFLVNVAQTEVYYVYFGDENSQELKVKCIGLISIDEVMESQNCFN